MPPEPLDPSIIQNSLAAGEIAPALYGRTDLAKYHQGVALMRNFFVDYKGGASTRPGTQYMGQAASAGYVRLYPFRVAPSIGNTYMLVFSDTKLRFIKNPGGPSYPNSSNAGFILSTGTPYTINTPYVAADLPFLKFSQLGNTLTITRKGYQRRVLTHVTDTNWTLTVINPSAIIAPPIVTALTITAIPAGSTDPINTRYQYAVTSVDQNGVESVAGPRIISVTGINIATTQGTVSLFWSPIANAAYYKVYKGLPSPGAVVPSYAEQLGFVGFAYGPTFTDSNIIPDFSRAPAKINDPFTPGKIVSYVITASSADWPIATTVLTITDAGGGTGAIAYPVFDTNAAGASGHIVGIVIDEPGQNYVTPVITASGGGTTFTATLGLTASSGLDPDVVGLFQQRQVYASSPNALNTLWLSRPGQLSDFRATNPIIDSDAITLTIATQEVISILWVQSMPGGLVIGTNAGILQLAGGSSSTSNPLAVTPASAVVVPQSYYGSADIAPIVIDRNILYIQQEGSIPRELQYNLFVNIYTGTDLSSLSSHLFYPHTIVSWAYQDTPNKVIWAIREDGKLLSLTYLKEQEILGWGQHDSIGLFESVAVVTEGTIDAVYVSVNRNGTRFIERMADRIYNQADDAWCLDAALSTAATFPAANIAVSALTGNITITSDAPIFALGDVGKTIRSLTGKALITAFIDTTHVSATIAAGYPFAAFESLLNTWRMNGPVSTVSGLSHLNGFSVMALVDGVPQGPFTVSGGAVNLTSPGSQVVIGLSFTPQIQTLYLDVAGQQSLQGRRKKVSAVTIRVKDAAGLKYGTTFSTLFPWAQGTSSTDPVEDLPYKTSALTLGDQRLTLDPSFNRVGSVCIEQDQPLPATILAIIPEVTQGDSP